MAYGLEITTSDGAKNVLDARTVIFMGAVSAYFPGGTTEGTTINVPYPAGWLSETESAGSFFSKTTVPTYTGGGPDPYSVFYADPHAITGVVQNDAASRFEITILKDLEADVEFDVTCHCFQRSIT